MNSLLLKDVDIIFEAGKQALCLTHLAEIDAALLVVLCTLDYILIEFLEEIIIHKLDLVVV